MKKILFVCAISMAFLGITFAAHAQWALTPEIGLSAVKSNEGMTNGETTAGVKVGVGLEYNFKPALSIKSGLYYARRGYTTLSILATTVDENEKRSTLYSPDVSLYRNFLQLPVMFNYGLQLNETVKLNFGAGPYIGVSLNDQEKEEGLAYNTFYSGEISSPGYGGEISSPEKGSYFADRHALDWGVSASVGVEINKRWVANLGYDLSLGEEYKDDGINANYHTLTLSIGYKCRLGK